VILYDFPVIVTFSPMNWSN